MKMKRLLALTAALVMLTGCGAKDKNDSSKAEETTTAATVEDSTAEGGDVTESEPVEEVDYIELSKTLAGEMAEGKYDTIVSMFNDDMSAALDEEKIDQTMQQVNALAGDFKEVNADNVETEEVTTNEDELVNTVKIRLVYTNMDFDVTFAYDSEGKLAGLGITPVTEEPKAMDTDEYTETEVKIGEFELDGMLAMPKGVEAPPIVILVHGTGSTDMNENAGICSPFKDISQFLAEQGVATLRYNKRFYQFPEEAEKDNITIDDEVLDDVDAAVAYAQTLVDEGKVSGIYVLGHSMGGMLAPTIAQRNDNVKGIISLAGTPRRLSVVFAEQLEAQVDQLSGEAKIYIERYLEQVETYRDTGEIVPNENPAEYQMFFGQTWWDSLDEIHPAEVAEELDIPMLFLQGDEDIQVYPDRDFPAWKEVLEDNENCEFIMYEGLGHFFTDNTNHIDSRVIDDVAAFVKGEKTSADTEEGSDEDTEDTEENTENQ